MTGAVAGALVYSYAYSANNRVFSGIYTPYATSNLLVSQRRALRIAREKYQIQAADGTDCSMGTLREDYCASVKNVTTKIAYQISQKYFVTVSSNPSVANVNLVHEMAVHSFLVKIETHTKYEKSLVVENASSNCTDMVTNIEGHAIRMYDTNPYYNLAGRFGLNWYLIPSVCLFLKYAT